MTRRSLQNLMLLIIPCIMSSIVRIQIYKENESMSFQQELFTSILPTIGVIVIGIFTLRSGNKRIDDIGGDTKEILPTTKNVEKYTEETNKCVTTDIKKSIDDTHKIAENDLKALVEEMYYQKRLKDEYAKAPLRDNVGANIDKLYEENALYSQRIRELEHENEMLSTQLENYKKLYNIELRKKNHNRDINF